MLSWKSTTLQRLYPRATLLISSRAAKIPGASQIKELTEAPGGGHMVILTDPLGFPINVLYGQKPAEGGPMPEILTTNYEVQKPRVAKFQRFKPGPAAVHKVNP